MGIANKQSLNVQLYKALANDARTRDAVIEVIDDRGIVTLQGSVNDAQTKFAAEEIVTQEPGVTSVVNELVLA